MECNPIPGTLLILGAALVWWALRSTWRDIVTMKDRMHKASAAARIRQMPPEQLARERHEDLVAEERRLCSLVQHHWADASAARRLEQVRAAIMLQLVGPASQPAIEQAPKQARPALQPVPLARRSTALAVVQRDREPARRS